MEEKIKELEAKIADLKNRFPAHSLKPHMFAELEDLEDELEELKKSKSSKLISLIRKKWLSWTVPNDAKCCPLMKPLLL